MPLFRDVLLCALAELVLCVALGLPLARRLIADRPLAAAISPILGWAVSSALALPILSWTGFGRLTVSLLCGAVVIGGVAALRPWRRGSGARAGFLILSGCAYSAAALLSVVPALAVWPKHGGGGILLAEPMFDHSKVAIIDDIVRLGLPPGNPFFGGLGSHSGLAYYYLWHFSAAMLGALVGASGWDADIALTWFTAFASLALMIGFAAKLGGCRLAPLLVVLLSLAASLRPVLRFVLGPHLLGRAFSPGPWPQAWIFQASWAPQHLAAASCVVVAVLIMSRLAAPCSWPLVPLLAIVVAAGFESSTWVGGVIFAAGALPIGVAFLLAERDARGRIDLVLKGAVAIILVAAISFRFLPRRIPGDGGERCRVPDRAAAVRGARRHAAREGSPAARPGGFLGHSAGRSVPRDLPRRCGGDGARARPQSSGSGGNAAGRRLCPAGRREPRGPLAVRQHHRQ